MPFLVLQCGSSARGDNHCYSDEDFVCLYKETDIPLFLQEKYNQLSFFSEEKIIRMRKQGALFLTHLDIESRAVEGDESLLSLVDGYRPDNHLVFNSLKSSEDFVVNLDWCPSGSDGKLWLMDVLYVAFRNIIFCKNALKNTYTFGFESAIDSIGLSEQDRKSLLKIRMGKYAYRSETVKNLELETPSMIALSCLANSLLGKMISFTEGGCTNWWNKWDYGYWDERLIERAVINGEIIAPDFISLIKDHGYNRNSLANMVKKLVLLARHQEVQVAI